PATEVYVIDKADHVQYSIQDTNGTTPLPTFHPEDPKNSFYAKQISAGLDPNKVPHPQVFAIDAQNNVEVSSGAKPFHLVGRNAQQARAISASVNGTVYAIDLSNHVWYYNGTDWTRIPGNVYAKQISAGVDVNGNPEVFEINQNDALYVAH